MTLTSETNRVQYSGDGSTAAFPMTFVFWLDADIQAVHIDTNGTETTWVKGTHYTLSGGSGATGTGGTIRLDVTDAGMQLGIANARVTTILDEDAMGSDSATALATQQSIKAYVDGAGGALEFVSTAAITAATTISVTSIAAGYDYIVRLEGFAPTSDGQVLWARVDAGAGVQSGVADYAWGNTSSGFNYFDVADAQMRIQQGSWGNDAGVYNQYNFELINPGGTAENTSLTWYGAGQSTDASPQMAIATGIGQYIENTNAIITLQFLWSGGSTFKAQGDITVWRRKRS